MKLIHQSVKIFLIKTATMTELTWFIPWKHFAKHR